jgi:hypothetical protein
MKDVSSVEIESIEYAGSKELIDISTTTHTFVASQILNHNSYSTTETYAGVAYEIILRNTAKYQRAAKRLIEKGYWLMATMWGETPAGIKITFNENKTLTRLQNAQAEKVEIDNQASLWALGIILQTDVSQNLGYNEPKTPYDTIEASEYPLKSGKDSAEAVDDEETNSDTSIKTVQEEEDDEG